MEKLLLNVNEVASLLSVSRRSVYKLTDSGRLPKPIKLGASVRWRAKELQEWLDDEGKA